MLLPIYAYGQPVLKKVAEPITPDYPDLKELIDNMWQTMYNADGVGLAAPQIGLSVRLFVVDTLEVERKSEKSDTDIGMKQVFINAQMQEETGELWPYEEGCLSIPRVTGDVERNKQIRITWQDENFESHEAVFTGINARVIQHEYDHIEGTLFTEKLKPLKKRLIQRKLEDIRTGRIKTDYRMKFFNVR
ncbi:MAG: peptide deformylase [Saprospiraceae bacterium]|nr:peptide deformylase [Saprospiraceae bacterium]MCB9343069.1 peptide deformylase [Lewinellaceae bacterium]